MHQDISIFPNKQFYDGNLKLLPEGLGPWQTMPLQYDLPKDASELMQKISQSRLCFFPSKANTTDNRKTNEHEAQLVADLVQSFAKLYQENGREFTANTVGIITPFRAQIAKIRAVLEDLDTEYGTKYSTCTIDTVERYQGGARDIIITSLCLNSIYQIEALNLIG